MKNYIEFINELGILYWVSIGMTVFIILIFFIPKEINHAKLIPLGFSEIEQIEIDAQRRNKPVNPITEYYAKLSDVTNKVFECWNTSLEFSIFENNNESFARELNARKDKIYKYEFDLFDSLPLVINKVLTSLKKYIELTSTLRNVEMEFGKTWKEDHNDEYILVPVTYTTTDSKGNTSTYTTLESRYDHTDHSYWYNKKQGEIAYQTGMEMMKYFYRLDWPGNLLQPSKTNAEGEYAADRSRRIERHSKSSLMEIAVMWNTGSLYNDLKDNILAYNNMYKLLKIWEKDKDKATDEFYQTGSHSSIGPKEYQSVKHVRDLANGVIQAINQLVFSLQTTKGELPVLKNMIEEYINVALNGKKGNARILKNEIISMSEQIYERNFPKGINHTTFRGWLLLLWIVVALTIGAGIGIGLKLWMGDY